MLRLARALERMGRHRDVDRLLLFALNGWRGLFEDPELIPEQDREKRYFEEVEKRRHNWTRPEKSPSPGNDIRERLESNLGVERTPVMEFNPRVRPVNPAEMVHGSGFIAPDGRCYIVQFEHEYWAREAFKDEDFTDLKVLDHYPRVESEEYQRKAILQKNGWVSYREGRFMGLTEDGEGTHGRVFPNNLTRAQKVVIKNLAMHFNEKDWDRFKTHNPELEDLVGA